MVGDGVTGASPWKGGPELPSFVSGLGPAWLRDMEGGAPQASL